MNCRAALGPTLKSNGANFEAIAEALELNLLCMLTDDVLEERCRSFWPLGQSQTRISKHSI
jgi:hypothetical protein